MLLFAVFRIIWSSNVFGVVDLIDNISLSCSDYIQCPYCMRRFNETAAARHINFCKDQASRRVFNPAETAAKIASRAQNKVQMISKKEPTVTSAVGTLLQNRATEPSNDRTTKAGEEKQVGNVGNDSLIDD
uniref:C2HC/C3H-type domain-containing protein n=1 Tax=Vombatus ursinus TaxID=29139 RepID=A0A4X2K1I0_VOMUR